MAFAPITFVATNYRDYKNWWLKAYEPGTTTPKPMSDNDTGSPQAAKYEIDKDGWPVTSGSAIVNPHIDGDYDIWLFPTEADADANDTTNALRLADDLSSPGSNIGGFTDYQFSTVNDAKNSIAIGGQSVTLQDGDVATIGERNSATFDLVLTSSVTPNDYNIIQSTDDPTLSFKLRVSNPLNVKEYGMNPNLSDCSTVWQLILDDSDVTGILITEAGNYTHNSESTCTKDIDIEFLSGAKFVEGGSFSGTYITKFEGQLTQIENLAGNEAKGGFTITFSSTPSLNDDDVFVIYNPNNSSWSQFRANYRAGEFCKTFNVTGNDAIITNPLYDDYIAGNVDVYRLDPIKVSIKGMDIEGSTAFGLIQLSRCRDSHIIDYKGKHTSNNLISIDRCYNTSITNPSGTNKGDGGDDYGIVITNSQTVKVVGGRLYARRHPITTGGTNEVCSVPCRDIQIIGSTLTNDFAANVHAADFHGNTEDSRYIDCTIYGGGTWQGKNNGYIDCIIYNAGNGVCVFAAEILGGEHYARSCQMISYVNPQPTGRGLINIGGQGVDGQVVSQFTEEDVTFEISNGSITSQALSNVTSVVLFRNLGATVNVNFEIGKGLRLNLNDYNQVLFTALSTGTPASQFIIIDDINSNLTGKALCNHNGNNYLNFPHRLQKQSGREEITTVGGTNNESGTPVVFNWIYPREPTIKTSVSDVGYLGSDLGQCRANPVSNSGLTPVLYSSVASNNLPSGTTLSLNWSAEISEI